MFLHKVLLWSLYLMGQCVHLFMKANLSARSQITPWDSISGYIRAHWTELLFKFFTNTMIFMLWWQNPAFFNVLLQKLWTSADITSVLPLTPATAGIYGLFCDVLLGWVSAKIPGLQAQMPLSSDK
jgi:hypothetical protein